MWEEAKKQLDSMNFPNEINSWKETVDQESHYFKSKKTGRSHNLLTYSTYLQPINGYEVEAKYNYCRECEEVRNKALRIYNNQDSLIYEKWFTYHGKDTTQRDVLDIVKEVFATLVLLLAI